MPLTFPRVPASPPRSKLGPSSRAGVQENHGRTGGPGKGPGSQGNTGPLHGRLSQLDPPLSPWTHWGLGVFIHLLSIN